MEKQNKETPTSSIRINPKVWENWKMNKKVKPKWYATRFMLGLSISLFLIFFILFGLLVFVQFRGLSQASKNDKIWVEDWECVENRKQETLCTWDCSNNTLIKTTAEYREYCKKLVEDCELEQKRICTKQIRVRRLKE